MDNERDAIDRHHLKKILIVDDTVMLISLLGRERCGYLPPPPTILFNDSRSSGRRPGQRRRDHPWR